MKHPIRRPLLTQVRFAPLFAALALILAAPSRGAGPIYSVDLAGADAPTILTVESLQGLVNRTAEKADQPAIYVLRNPEDAYWLFEYTPKAEPLSPKDFIARFKERAAGQVLYDPTKPYTAQVALSAAGALDAVVTSTDLGIKTVLDTRRDWNTAGEAYRWAIGNLLRRCNREKIGVLTPTGDGPLDYLIKERIFVLGLDPMQLEDRRLIEQALRRMPAGIMVIGPPALQEEPWATLVQREGHSLVPCSPLANLSFHSAFRPTVPLIQAKHYLAPSDKPLVAFACLGSPDLAYAFREMAALWAAPGRGSVPIGWMVPPALLDCAPAVLQRYFAEAALSGSDQLVMAPNGPDALPLTRNRYLSEALHRLRDDTDRADLRVMAIGDPGDPAAVTDVLRRCIREGGVQGVLALQGTAVESGLYNDTPAVAEAVRATTPAETLKAIREAAGGGKYVLVVVPLGAMTPAEIAMITAHLTDYQVVGPLDLIEAARERSIMAAAKPADKPTYQVASVTLAPAKPGPTDQVAVTARLSGGARADAASVIYTVNQSPLEWTERMTRLGDGSFMGLLPPMLHGGVVKLRVRAVGAQGIATSIPVLFEVRAPDSDNDGLTDPDEALFRSDPHSPDTDGDGLLDGNDPDPLRPTVALATYLPPIVPPADGHVLAAESGSSLADDGRKVSGDAQFTYRLPLDGVPEGTSALLTVIASGDPALGVSKDGQTFTPISAAPGGPGPRAVQWSIPADWLPAGALHLRFACGDPAQSATLHSVRIGSSPDAPSILLRGVEPVRPAPGVRCAASAKVWDPVGIESVTLLYGVTGPAATRPMTEWSHSQIYGADLPDLASGNVLTIQVKAVNKQGRTCVSPALAFPVGVTRAETISLLAARDFEGEMRPWPATGMDWRWGTAGQTDRSTASFLGGRYLVWLLAAPRGAGLQVQADGALVGEVKADALDGWQRIGTVDLAARKHSLAVICTGGPQGAVRGYAQLLLSTDGSAAPRGAVVTDYFNTVSIISPLPGAAVSRSVTILATATGNVVRAECYVDQTLLGRKRLPPFEFRWDTSEFRPGDHTIEIRGINGADQPMLSTQITVEVAR